MTIKAWKQANKEYVKEVNRSYRANNVERVRATRSKWYQRNKAKQKAHARNREAIKLQRTPKWLTKEQLQQIEEFYVMVEDLQWLNDPSDPLQVDHIVPLQGKNVSGLHVPWNLQILPRSVNIAKGNK